MQISGGNEPAILGTLAAAYAEAGRFSDAVKTAEQAIRLATAAGKSKLADQILRPIGTIQNRKAVLSTSRTNWELKRQAVRWQDICKVRRTGIPACHSRQTGMSGLPFSETLQFS